ncbi:MAG: argininosuccinate lyase [Actinomycetota bacterium]|jgi:argininosuccinate lyase|nr:argininosuccinate lyase [Actinomycetota bacterium]
MTVTPGVDTGRISTALDPEAHRIVYDQYLPVDADGLGAELELISEVDRAHLVMLAEQGIADTARVRLLLREITALRQSGFEPVRRRAMPRGVYLAYEGHLVEVLGEEVGGVLHTGRSRNDLNATTIRLRTRAPYRAYLTETEQLGRVLLSKAAEYRDVTMPAYTHGQPAVPISYGHYLAGVASAVVRGLEGLVQAGSELDTNPLGAGAVGGTSVPIDPRRTAELLGFARAVPNSVDAVASRDFVLRLLSAAAVLGVALARAARDLTIWTTEEYGLLTVADDLVGSSSMMPQKRNPFLLEHVQGRATAGLGGFIGAASAMVTAPYTNAIAVGTEAARHLWPGLKSGTDAVTLLRLVVCGAVPNADRMTARAADGYTAATYLAEQLVLDGTPFRTAHHRVGQTVLGALATGESLADAIDPEILGTGTVTADSLRPDAVAAACAYGGGPGGGAVDRTVAGLSAELDRLHGIVTERRDRWTAGGRALDAAVGELTRQR